VLLTARLGTAILRLQIDVGFGDAITPAPVITEFPSILGQSLPRIRTYPRETVVAEKFEAVVQLGMTNSRMKDYYDLWFMSRHFEFEGSTLAAAVRATFSAVGRAAASNRRVISSMNEYVWQLGSYLTRTGDPLELSLQLNKTPMSAVGSKSNYGFS
jgi:hypothetical protein